MRRFGRRNAKRGEIIAMVLTSVLVLSVLTVTGLYIKNRNSTAEQDGYYIDFDALEAEINNEVDNLETANDLDYTGTEEEYDYTNQGLEAVQSGSIEKEDDDETTTDDKVVENQVETSVIQEEVVVQPEPQPDTTTTISTTVTNTPALDFSEEESLVWPIVGNILINYSMDQTVYFPTLDQYKYNPALVISAGKGEQITAATDGLVINIHEDNQLGNVIVTDIGNGYNLIYGQVHDVNVYVGQYITTGQLIGNAGTPTKYYSVEGCNLYFKMTKNGEPVNPTTYLE